jgi:hypothetical protein
MENVFTIAEYTATYATPIYPPIPTSDGTPEFEDSELGLRWLRGGGESVESEEDDESADELLPPDIRRQPGRPRKKRIRGHSEVEPAKRIRCGNCKEFCGHNARTCRNPPACA